MKERTLDGLCFTFSSSLIDGSRDFIGALEPKLCYMFFFRAFLSHLLLPLLLFFR